MDLCNHCKDITLTTLESLQGHAYHESWSAVIESSRQCDLCWKIRYYLECLRARYGDMLMGHILSDDDLPEKISPLCLRLGRLSKYNKEITYLIIERQGLAHDAILQDQILGPFRYELENFVCALEVTEAGVPPVGVNFTWEISGYSMEDSTRLASKWLQQCVRDHVDCAYPFESNTPTLPTRVLKISSVLANDVPTVFLCEGEGEQGEYVALSHCWGKTSIPRTLKANVDDHKRGINYDSLPRTFRDAIAVTLSLGIHYLWIDSLCIIQDDKEDWGREAGMMAQLYERAVVVIAATAAPDAEFGLFDWKTVFQPTSIRSQTANTEGIGSNDDQKCGVTVNLRYGGDQPLDLPHPLDHRAWVCQERILSRRLVSFERTGLKWKCAEAQAQMGRDNDEFDKLGWMLQGAYVLSPPGPNFRVALRKSGTLDQRSNSLMHQLVGQKGDEALSIRWYDVIKHYTARKLTNLSDKLPAIAGLAQAFQDGYGSKVCGGLWLKDMMTGLMWRRVRSDKEWLGLRPKELAALPSWSWASVNGPVEWCLSYVGEIETKAKFGLFTDNASLTASSFDAPMVGATLLVEVVVGKDDISGRLDEQGQRNVWLTTSNGRCLQDQEQVGKPLGSCVVDYEQDIAGAKIYCMYVMEHENMEEEDHTWGAFPRAYDVLLLKAINFGQCEFKRVGVGWLDAASGVFGDENWKRGAGVVILR
ncbi:HET-domain-containing protein [Lepidopterella palustris CBS 459.81]|uniref:HET-domain-containing protein n=1 Tax=Lepidopterella palustris CBS 459.81 TaxID=1314670 RepID=A0A8E2EHF3_9PEZI|nr:HET-domain-containing protein [Lepidopterella palustris CBS 459.81]